MEKTITMSLKEYEDITNENKSLKEKMILKTVLRGSRFHTHTSYLYLPENKIVEDLINENKLIIEENNSLKQRNIIDYIIEFFK